jgi:hypothetical protein
VTIECLLTWRASREKLEKALASCSRAGSHAVENKAMTLRMVMANLLMALLRMRPDVS